MPLSPPAERAHLHTRSIEMRGYSRADGLWDIEGHLTDVKTYGFDNAWRGRIEPDTPLHDMWARLTVDDALAVRAVEVATDAAPFRLCPEVAPNFRALEGLTIGPGWSRRVKQLLGGHRGCTHLVEMIVAMATVAIQTQVKARQARGEAQERPGEPTATPAAGRRPAFLASCYALASDSETTRQKPT